MATIDEIRAVERMMQTLDENPHLMEALRSRVLTRELLELPANFAKIAALIGQITERLDRLTEQVNQNAEQLVQLTERLDRLTEQVNQNAEQLVQLTERLDRLTEQVNQNTDQLARLTEQVNQIAEQLVQLTERVDRNAEQLGQLIRQVSRLQDDVGAIKGFITDAMVIRLAPAIALAMGLSLRRNLKGPDLSAMVAGQDLAGISAGELESFLLADLIMEAGNGDGETVYLAVEASYTVDDRDTDRAVRNAAYLTRFTGKPARAVVTGRHKDWKVDEPIEAGLVLWYQFPAQLLRGL